jgi:hypothetical protein
MKTQYERILDALRAAGKKGCTNHDLMIHSNCPWRRISEMAPFGWVRISYGGKHRNDKPTEYIEQDVAVRNGRMLRIYRVKKS